MEQEQSNRHSLAEPEPPSHRESVTLEVRNIDIKNQLVYVDVPHSNPTSVHHEEIKPCYVMDSWKGETIGVLTVGEDTPGMNQAIRSAVRMGMYLGAKIVYIKQGFSGMVRGGDMFEEATWSNSSRLTDEGGTEIGSCIGSFLDREGQINAAKNLIHADITCLLIIGGEQALRDTETLYNDWAVNLRELMLSGCITKMKCIRHHSLCIVNILACVEHSILGTDYTLGFDTARQRITEVCETISSSASRSKKAFVIEVLSGHLALAIAVVCSASMVYCQELTSDGDRGDWRKTLIVKVRADINDDRKIMIVVADGMKDNRGNSITSAGVVECLRELCLLDARLMVVGDLQRGGKPSVQDRLFATRMGAKAIHKLKEISAKPAEGSRSSRGNHGPLAIGVVESKLVTIPVVGLVATMDKYRHLMEKKEFSEAFKLKSPSFNVLLSLYRDMMRLRPAVELSIPGMKCKKIGIVKCGHVIPGTCVLVKNIAMFNASKCFLTVGFMSGFESLVSDQMMMLGWDKVKKFKISSSDCLDASDVPASKVGLARIGAAILRNGISGLILIGDTMALRNLSEIWQGKNLHNGLLIPMCTVPVGCYNNIPGSDTSLGADTAANHVVNFLDMAKVVAHGTQKSVIVVETPGEDNDYLARVCALCAGADAIYTLDQAPKLDQIIDDAQYLRRKLESTNNVGIIVRSKNASKNYTMEFLQRVFADQGKGVYKCDTCFIKDIQMGSKVTNIFRIWSKICGKKASEWVTSQVGMSARRDGSVSSQWPASKSVMCLKRSSFAADFKAVNVFSMEDIYKVKPKSGKWDHFNALCRILEGNYKNEFITDTDDRTSTEEPYMANSSSTLNKD